MSIPETRRDDVGVHAVGESYRRYRGEDTCDAIVIGSGLGGMTTAALLAKHTGRRVLVLERHYVAGGFTHTFRRPGYEWDVGVHYVGALGNREGFFARSFAEVTEDRLEWARMDDPYDTIILGDRHYEYLTGRENWRARMHEYFPEDSAAIDAYLEEVKGASRSSLGFFAEKALPPDQALPTGQGLDRNFLRYSDRTTREVLAAITANPELAAVLTGQWGDYGMPPATSSFAIHAMVAGHYWDGGFYPVGGAGRIAAAIAPVITRAGGRILVSAEVEQVLVRGDRAAGVRMADGREFQAPLVISDAGLVTTAMRLLPPEAPGREELAAVARRIAPSSAHICLYTGLKHSDAELGLKPGNLWVYPGNDFDQLFSAAAADPGGQVPFAFISFPSARDPDFQRRHPGRSTIDVISVTPYAWFQHWENRRWRKRGADYEALKDRLAQQLLDLLYRAVPQVRGKVDYYELSTPLSTRHFANFSQGEIYGLDHTPARFRARALRPHTGLPGFFLTGADITTCGLGGALNSGYLTASVIAGRPLFPAARRQD